MVRLNGPLPDSTRSPIHRDDGGDGKGSLGGAPVLMTIRWTGTQAVNDKRTALDGQSTNHIYKGDPLVCCDQRDASWINAVCK